MVVTLLVIAVTPSAVAGAVVLLPRVVRAARRRLTAPPPQPTGPPLEQVAADAERHLLTDLDDRALRGLIGGKLVRRTKRAVLQAEAALEPHRTEQREADAREGRRVTVRTEPDAMGSLWALLPADQLRQFTLGLDELTRRQKQADTLAGRSGAAGIAVAPIPRDGLGLAINDRLARAAAPRE